MRYITIISIISKSVMVIFIFLLVKTKNDYLLAAGIQSGSSLIAGIVAFLYAPVIKNLILVLPSFKTLTTTFIEGWHVFLSTFAVSLYTSATVFFLGIFTSSESIGYYSASEKIIRAILALLSPISQAVYPYVNNLYSESKEMATIFLSKLLKIFAVSSFCFSGSLFLFSSLIVNLILGPEFQPAVSLLKYMAFLPFLIAISNVLGIQTMLTFGYQKSFSKILIAAGILNIVLVILFAPYIGVSAGAISVLISEAFVTISMLHFIFKQRINLFKIG